MIGGFFSKLQNTIEAIDGQAAAQSTQASNNGRIRESGNSSSDDIKATQDYESLLTAIQKAKIQTASLEEQLKCLTQENAKLESELQESEMNISNLTEDMNESEKQRSALKIDLKTLQMKHQSDTENFEKARSKYEELKMKLEKDLVSATEQNASLQHDLQMKMNENAKLNEELQNQKSEISILESDIIRYREKAVASLTVGEQSSTIAGQLEVLETERTRLKERYSRAQQKIAQLETATREIEEQMQNELGEFKQQQVALENELFRARTQNEALTHELELVRSQLFTSREAAESRFKAQIAAERSEHRAEISKIREEQSKRSSSSSEEKLIQANAMIESLKSEKATLMLMLEGPKFQNENSINFGIGIPKRKRRQTKSIASMLPAGSPRFFISFFEAVDSMIAYISDHFSSNPVLFFIFLVWFVIIHIMWIVK